MSNQVPNLVIYRIDDDGDFAEFDLDEHFDFVDSTAGRVFSLPNQEDSYAQLTRAQLVLAVKVPNGSLSLATLTCLDDDGQPAEVTSIPYDDLINIIRYACEAQVARPTEH